MGCVSTGCAQHSFLHAGSRLDSRSYFTCTNLCMWCLHQPRKQQYRSRWILVSSSSGSGSSSGGRVEAAVAVRTAVAVVGGVAAVLVLVLPPPPLLLL